jgi:hypothetical protein
MHREGCGKERHCHSLGGERLLLDQRCDQPQQLLLLWPLASLAEKGSDVDIGDLAA